MPYRLPSPIPAEYRAAFCASVTTAEIRIEDGFYYAYLPTEMEKWAAMHMLSELKYASAQPHQPALNR